MTMAMETLSTMLKLKHGIITVPIITERSHTLKSYIVMAIPTRDSCKRVASMDGESSHGKMALAMRENINGMRSMVAAPFGQKTNSS